MSGDSPSVADDTAGSADEVISSRNNGPTRRPKRSKHGGAAGLTGHSRRGDVTFAGISYGAAIFLLVLMIMVALFLVTKAVGAIGADKVNWLTSFAWDPDGSPSEWGVALIAWGTLITSLFALLLGAPIAVGTALFISQYAPRRLSQLLGYIVDLLAAVPSVVYGLWGIIFLVPHMTGVSKFFGTVLGSWIPIFKYHDAPNPRSIFAAGIVLAIMILPIVAAISREVFLQTPRENIEAAYALGATKWEMIRLAVLPYGRSGVISAIVLGFGRALGETIAVAMVLATIPTFFTHFLDPGGNTIAANIAIEFKDSLTNGRGALIASGLVLFVMTLIVNYVARVIARRSTGGGGSPAVATAGAGAAAAASPVEAYQHSEVAAAEKKAAEMSRSGGGELAPSPLGKANPMRRATDWTARIGIWLSFLIAVLPLASILILVVGRGSHVFGMPFLSHSMRGVDDLQPGGGAYHAILGTIEQAGLATVMAVPIGILTAIYLVEYGRGRLALAVTFVVDVMMGLPSIVAGLFVLALWILALHIQPAGSGFAGSLALLIIMLPLVIRSAEEMLKLVPHGLREASYALGVSKWRTITKVVVPTALPGIITGIMLAVARVFGETAPVLLVVGFTESINQNPFSGPQGSLPEFIYTEVSSSYAPALDRAWAGALTLILIVMLLNLIARLIAWWKRPGRA
ncbi:MAG TPA: phosphate ABC transporter permease subunit PstC [Actinocrinis sp.]|jgi:phosphate transport system permease protein